MPSTLTKSPPAISTRVKQSKANKGLNNLKFYSEKKYCKDNFPRSSLDEEREGCLSLCWGQSWDSRPVHCWTLPMGSQPSLVRPEGTQDPVT